MRYVCVDVDGVLLDFNDNLARYLKDTRNIDFDPAKCIDYDYKYDLGFDRQIIYDCFKEPEFYKGLRTKEGVVPALKKLQLFFRTKAYTGSVNNDIIINRRRQVCKTFGLYGEPFIGERKLTDFGAIALFDDCLGVHKQWIEEGSKAKLFLIDAPYNQKTEENKSSLDWSRIIRCKNFEDAVNKFLSGF